MTCPVKLSVSLRESHLHLRDGRPRETDRRDRRRGHVHGLLARRDRRTEQEPETELPGGGEGHKHHRDRGDFQVRWTPHTHTHTKMG